MAPERPVRVAWVADAAWPPRSGIGNHAFQLIRGLSRLGEPVRLVHYGRRPVLLDGPSPETILPDWMNRRYLRRILPALHPGLRRGLDIMHFPSEFDSYYLRPGRALRVVTVHGCAGSLLPPELHSRLTSALERRLARHLAGVEGVVTVSESSAREIAAVYGLPRERLAVISNGISPVFREAVRAPLAWYRRLLGSDLPYLLSVGLTIPKKNLAATLGVLRWLADRGHPHLLVQVGPPGEAEGQLRSGAGALGLGDRLVRLGYLGEDDLGALYAGAAALIFPSFHEGFGLPVVEAMAAGCPVVASDIPALREITAGSMPLFDPRDEEGMAVETERLVTDTAWREERIGRGRAAAAPYDWDRSAALLLAEYRRLLGRTGPAALSGR